jgi:hypothetical protein
MVAAGLAPTLLQGTREVTHIRDIDLNREED